MDGRAHANGLPGRIGIDVVRPLPLPRQVRLAPRYHGANDVPMVVTGHRTGAGDRAGAPAARDPFAEIVLEMPPASRSPLPTPPRSRGSRHGRSARPNDSLGSVLPPDEMPRGALGRHAPGGGSEPKPPAQGGNPDPGIGARRDLLLAEEDLRVRLRREGLARRDRSVGGPTGGWETAMRGSAIGGEGDPGSSRRIGNGCWGIRNERDESRSGSA